MRRGYLTEERGGGGLGSGGGGGDGRRGAGVGGAEKDCEEEDAGEGEEEREREAHPPRPLLPPALERRSPLFQERPPPHRIARGGGGPEPAPAPPLLSPHWPGGRRRAEIRDAPLTAARARELLDFPFQISRRAARPGSVVLALGPTCLA
jgi:hypothetical protein